MKIKQFQRFIFVLILSVLFFLNAGKQSQAIQMKILTCEEPPMNFQEGKKVTGIITDIVEELKKRTNTTGSIELYPWVRAYKRALEDTNVVLFTGGRTEQRENLFKWVGPVINKRWVLYAKRDSTFEMKSLADARKVESIAVMRKDSRAQMLEAEGFKNLHLVSNHLQGLKMLMKGRVQLFASADIEGPILAKKAKIKPNDMKIVWTLKKIQAYIIISKKTPNDIVKVWQEAFEEIKKDGTFEKIGRKWGKILDIPLSGESGIMEVLQETGKSLKNGKKNTDTKAQFGKRTYEIK